jgi:hypothetical protein
MTYAASRSSASTRSSSTVMRSSGAHQGEVPTLRPASSPSSVRSGTPVSSAMARRERPRASRQARSDVGVTSGLKSVIYDLSGVTIAEHDPAAGSGAGMSVTSPPRRARPASGVTR